MKLLTKIKLIIWYIFNKKKYQDYIKLNFTKLYIFNKFYLDNDIWHILTITSDEEVINHFGINPEKLAETYQFFTQDIKALYNSNMNRPYEIISFMPDDDEPVLFRTTADKIMLERERQREVNPSAFDEENFMFN